MYEMIRNTKSNRRVSISYNDDDEILELKNFANIYKEDITYEEIKKLVQEPGKDQECKVIAINK